MDHIDNPAHNTFMAMAIAAMQRTALEERSGEPFGAVIVKNNELVAVAGNSVAVSYTHLTLPTKRIV